MSALSETLGNAASPHTITHRGKTYTISLVDQRAKTAFERWNFERDKERLREVKDILPPDDYAIRARALSDAWMGGEFDFESPSSMAAMQTEKGMLALARILIGCSEEEVICLAVERSDDLTAIMELVFKESMPEVPEKLKEKMLKDKDGQVLMAAILDSLAYIEALKIAGW